MFEKEVKLVRDRLNEGYSKEELRKAFLKAGYSERDFKRIYSLAQKGTNEKKKSKLFIFSLVLLILTGAFFGFIYFSGSCIGPFCTAIVSTATFSSAQAQPVAFVCKEGKVQVIHLGTKFIQGNIVIQNSANISLNLSLSPGETYVLPQTFERGHSYQADGDQIKTAFFKC
ncbi:MAG: hypothetical protein QW735_00125 [archaeon]